MIQSDPYVMYLIVRKELYMSLGKTAAQCAHASGLLVDNFYRMCLLEEDKERFVAWRDADYRKVALQASDADFEKIKKELSAVDVVVVDGGLTELAPNTETVIGLWPLKKSLAPKSIKRLQLLK